MPSKRKDYGESLSDHWQPWAPAEEKAIIDGRLAQVEYKQIARFLRRTPCAVAQRAQAMRRAGRWPDTRKKELHG